MAPERDGGLRTALAASGSLERLHGRPDSIESQLQVVVSRSRGRYRSRKYANIKKERRRRALDKLAELAQKRTLLTSFMVNSRMHSQSHAIKVAEGFYLLLANGYSPIRIPDANRVAEGFLTSNMSLDVEWATLTGVDVFLRHHQLYSEATRRCTFRWPKSRSWSRAPCRTAALTAGQGRRAVPHQSRDADAILPLRVGG